MSPWTNSVLTILFLGLISGLIFLVGRNSERARVLRIIQKNLQENAARLEQGPKGLSVEQFYKMQAYNRIKEQMLE